MFNLSLPKRDNDYPINPLPDLASPSARWFHSRCACLLLVFGFGLGMASQAHAQDNNEPTGLLTLSPSTVRIQQTVTVDTASIQDEDRLGDFSYRWLHTGTVDTTVQTVIAGATSASFMVTDALFQRLLIAEVSDIYGAGNAEVLLTGANVQPSGVTANAGLDQDVVAGQMLTLDGSGSRGADGTTTARTYQWSQTAPAMGAGSAIAFAGQGTSMITFETPESLVAALTFRLAVGTDVDTVNIRVAAPPDCQCRGWSERRGE